MVAIIGSFKDGKGKDYGVFEAHDTDSLFRTLKIKYATNFITKQRAERFIEKFNNTSTRSIEVNLRIKEYQIK